MYSESVFQKASPPARSTVGTSSHHHLISYSRQDPDENGVDNESSKVVVTNGQLRKTVRHMIGSTLEPYLEILRHLDTTAIFATEKASSAEKISSKALEIENITRKHLGRLEDHCDHRVQALESTVAKLKTAFQQTKTSIKKIQSQTQTELIAAVQKIPEIQASQRECATAVQDIINLLLFALHHLSPSSTAGIDKLDLAILRHPGHTSPLARMEDRDDWNTLKDSAEKNHSLPPNCPIQMATILDALLSHGEEISELLHPTDSHTNETVGCIAGIQRLDTKPVAACHASSENADIASVVDDSFKPEHILYNNGIYHTASALSEAEEVSARAEDKARDTLRHAVSMSQRLQSAQNALHKTMDPLDISIEHLTDDLKSFEAMAKNILMDQREGVYAVAQNIEGLLSAQRQCTHLIATFSVILLQIMIHRFNPSEEGVAILHTGTNRREDKDGAAAALEFNHKNSTPDQLYVGGLSFDEETEDLHCVPYPTMESLVPDCGGDQYEEAIEYADSHTDSLSESDVGLMLESEELNTQSLSEELHIEMPQEILSETDCGLDDGHRENVMVVKPRDFDIYMVANHSLPKNILPNHLIQGLKATEGQLLKRRFLPRRPKLDFAALVRDFTSFSPLFPFLRAFLVFPKPTIYIHSEGSIQYQEYNSRGLVLRAACHNMPSQDEFLSVSLLSDHVSSLRISRPHSPGLWRSGGPSPISEIPAVERAPGTVPFSLYIMNVAHFLRSSNAPINTSLSIWGCLFASSMSIPGDQYRTTEIFTVDPCKWVLDVVNLLSAGNRTVARLQSYASILAEVPNLSSTPKAALLIRSAKSLACILNIQISEPHIFGFGLDHVLRPHIWLCQILSTFHSLVAHTPAQAKSTKISPVTRLQKLCLCICLGIALYCGICFLKFEQDVQWDIPTNQWGNQESRRAQKNSYIRSNFRPV